ncbi:MAG TPA: PAS domain-containing protein [Terriglobales bacterium]
MEENEDKLLRAVALQNSRAVLLARERAERALRESNERITNILESITDAFVVLDKDWRFTYVNPQAEQVVLPLNKPNTDIMGKELWQEFPGLIGTAVDSNLRRAAAENVKVEFEYFSSPLNAWFQVRAYPSREGLSVYFLDVSVRKETEQKVRRSEEDLRTLADSIPQLAWMANPNGEIFWYNRRWYEYTGTNLAQMQGWGWQALHDPTMLPTVVEEWKKSIRTATPFEMEFPLRGADGLYRWFLTRVTPVLDDQGRVTRWFGTNTNIDEQRQLLESLSEARDHLEQRVQERTVELENANENLRDLSARLLQVQDEERKRLARELHDSVGQILAALSMNLSVVQSQAHKLDSIGAKAVADNAHLLRQASREIRTISHLLHPPLLEIAGLASALRWYVDGFAERSKIQVDLEIPSDFDRLPNDTELAIFRIVQECLTNIHRHSGSKTAEIRIRQEAGVLVVQVRDRGKGIPREKQMALTEAGRSGVGFGGMRERIRQLGGSLAIQSEENGTLVSAILKIA